MKLSEGAAARVARLLLEGGPTTAAGVAERLGLTPAAVRRHLDALVADGLASATERPPFGPTSPRGRGRPAKYYALTPAGSDRFEQAYDDLAVGALRYLAETQGPEAVLEFARRQVSGAEHRYAEQVAGDGPAQRALELVEVLSADGYAASTLPGGPSGAVQVCQHHCPVAHVAQEFPQFCEAETESFQRILGSHVTRLATIAAGDGVCTTLVTAPPTAVPEKRRNRRSR